VLLLQLLLVVEQQLLQLQEGLVLALLALRVLKVKPVLLDLKESKVLLELREQQVSAELQDLLDLVEMLVYLTKEQLF
jgi:hypothetical protein